MEVTGKIKLIGETQTFGSNGFRKKEMVITTDEQYPQDLLIELVQDKVELISDDAIGQNVKVSINLRGREWINPQGEAKYFNSIQGWRIENLAQAAPQDLPPVDQFQPAPDLSSDEPDDLPF